MKKVDERGLDADLPVETRTLAHNIERISIERPDSLVRCAHGRHLFQLCDICDADCSICNDKGYLKEPCPECGKQIRCETCLDNGFQSHDCPDCGM